MPKTNANLELARQIAEEFGEPEETALFLTLLKRHSEALIRRAYEETQKVPAHKVRKSRAAIFLFLVGKFASQEQRQAPPLHNTEAGGGTNGQLPPVPVPPNPSIHNT